MRPLWAALALAASLAVCPAVAQPVEGRLTVIGRGLVERVPDLATIQMGVSSKGPNPAAAMDANSAAAGRVIALAKRFGVEARDIRTSSVSLSEEVRPPGEPNGRARPEPDGYIAHNTVTVLLRDLPRVGAFMREVLTAGANRIDGVSFGLGDPAEAADAARLAAVDDARRKATRLAERAEVKLGRVLRLDHPPRLDRAGPEAADMPLRRAAGRTVPVESGLIEVSAEVDMTFATE